MFNHYSIIKTLAELDIHIEIVVYVYFQAYITY